MARVAQTIHRGAQLGFGLGELVCQLCLALLKICDCLITGFFGFMQFLRHPVQLGDVIRGHAGKAV